MAIHARIEPERLEPDRELGLFLAAVAGDGAVVSFTGLVRPNSKTGEPLRGLYLDHYPQLTQYTLDRIAADARTAFAISRAWIVHRCGFVAAHEPIVFAATASAHRRVAFEAADYVMDRLKTEAGFWKREEGETTRAWIEPTEFDLADRRRWDGRPTGDALRANASPHRIDQR